MVKLIANNGVLGVNFNLRFAIVDKKWYGYNKIRFWVFVYIFSQIVTKIILELMLSIDFSVCVT